jgi:hypothetical protein
VADHRFVDFSSSMSFVITTGGFAPFGRVGKYIVSIQQILTINNKRSMVENTERFAEKVIAIT